MQIFNLYNSMSQKWSNKKVLQVAEPAKILRPWMKRSAGTKSISTLVLIEVSASPRAAKDRSPLSSYFLPSYPFPSVVKCHVYLFLAVYWPLFQPRNFHSVPDVENPPQTFLSVGNIKEFPFPLAKTDHSQQIHKKVIFWPRNLRKTTAFQR